MAARDFHDMEIRLVLAPGIFAQIRPARGERRFIYLESQLGDGTCTSQTLPLLKVKEIGMQSYPLTARHRDEEEGEGGVGLQESVL